MWKCFWIAAAAIALLGAYYLFHGPRAHPRSGGEPRGTSASAPGKEGPSAAPASKGNAPVPLSGDWFDESEKALAPLRGETRSGDEELLRWLIDFSTRFGATPRAVADALAMLRQGKGSERFRAILELLVAVSSDSEGQAEFKDIALSKEELAAGAALRAIFLRMRHVRSGPPLALWFEEFWMSAMGDLYIGNLLDPGNLDRVPPQENVGMGSDAGTPTDEPDFHNWPDPDVEHADAETVGTLERIAADGQAPAAKMPALRELRPGPSTDRVVRAVLADDKGSALLRAFCFEKLDQNNASNWPLIEQALKTETNMRALASAVEAAGGPAPSTTELVRVLEGLAERVPLEQAGDVLDRLTDNLTLMGTQEGLDALVRMARFGKSDAVRFDAASKIAVCSYGSTFTQPRIDALLGLLRDPDPVVASMGASGLMDARQSNALRDVAAPAMDESVMARIRSLSTDPHTPDGVRNALSTRLQSLDSRTHR